VRDWHKLEVATVLEQLGTDITSGLQEEEAARRLSIDGPNELVELKQKGIWSILWEQLTATMVVILIIAAVVTFFVGDHKDTAAIMAIVILNTILGSFQNYKAEKAMAALRRLSAPSVKVRRNGQVKEIPSREVVPGDILLLESGNLVPADCRLLESMSLKTQEASLTGESEPVEKCQQVISGEDLPLGDRRNMVYLGTIVTHGRGRAIVTETGMRTELGRIAEMIQKVEQEATPLQKKFNKLGQWLIATILILVSAIFIIGLLNGESIKLMFMIGVSMAVAAVPEALPAVVTITLALGAQRMLKRHALIRNLQGIETLGSITVICSDKTGTLTENHMTVKVLDVADRLMELCAQPGKEKELVESNKNLAVTLLLASGALCNDTIIKSEGTEPDLENVVGDPTETALVAAALLLGLKKTELERNFPRVTELPFDSNRKRMTTVHQVSSRSLEEMPALKTSFSKLVIDDLPYLPYVAFTKGAVESLMEVSSQVWANEHSEPLTDEWRIRIAAANEQMTKNGMRALGVAFRPLSSLSTVLEQDLIFIGIVGMIDPARSEVKDAVLICKTAGIRPVMITGDHPMTAQYIAQLLSITSNGRILTGPELDRMSIEELMELVGDISIYARVSPEHKLKIVQALQNRGQIVAMTGDGVNDAPALKKADIGLAMGITGTDVAKEAADMVLLDDNFTTIVAAIEEGRVIYDNIRKYIKNTLTGNFSAIMIMLFSPLLNMPLSLLPLQILWMNLVTDGLPSIALGLEPAERNAMRRSPYSPNENILGRGMGWHIVGMGISITILVLGIGYWYWQSGNASWQTMILTTLIFSRMAHILATRSEQDSLFRIGLTSNMPLLGAIALTFLLQLAVIYISILQEYLKTVSLSLKDLAISLTISAFVFLVVELEKRLLRRSSKRILATEKTEKTEKTEITANYFSL
jgi:P-type Ca2+ transporter type 2C